MQLTLPADVQKEIDERVKSGRYESAEQVITAAVFTLVQQESISEFSDGELDALIEEGEADICSGNVIDGDVFFAEMRRMSDERRGGNR